LPSENRPVYVYLQINTQIDPNGADIVGLGPHYADSYDFLFMYAQFFDPNVMLLIMLGTKELFFHKTIMSPSYKQEFHSSHSISIILRKSALQSTPKRKNDSLQ
jgi:hypothetical protein